MEYHVTGTTLALAGIYFVHARHFVHALCHIMYNKACNTSAGNGTSLKLCHILVTVTDTIRTLICRHSVLYPFHI